MGDQLQALDLCLGQRKAIEGVWMRDRKGFDGSCMLGPQSDLGHARTEGQGVHDIGTQCRRRPASAGALCRQLKNTHDRK